LGKVTTFKVGPLSPLAVFPALVIMPDSGVITSRKSGNIVDVARQFTVYTFVKAGTIALARSILQPLIEETKEVFQTNFQMKDNNGVPRAIHLHVGDSALEAVETPKDSLLWQGSQEFTFLSRDRIPADNGVYTSVIETTGKALIAEIEAIFEAGRMSELLGVNGEPLFHEFQFWQTRPVTRFPSAMIVENGDTTTERFTGRDQVSRRFNVSVLTRYSSEDKALLGMLDLADTVSGFIHGHRRMRGKASDTVVGTVSYNTAEGGNAYLFEALIPFTCKCWEQVKYT